MATKKHEDTVFTADNAKLAAIMSASLSYGDNGEFQVSPADLPPVTLTRLLENGFTQMISDVGALSGEQKVRIVAKAKNYPAFSKSNPVPKDKKATDWLKKVEDEDGVNVAAILADHVAAKRTAKIAAMLDGTLGEFAGRLSPVEREMRDIAEGEIANAAKRKNLKLTDEQTKKNVTALLDRDADRIRALAEQRIADLAKNAGEIELDLD